MKQIVKYIINRLVDLLSYFRGYSFPPNFIWYWKLDILFNRYELETTRLFCKHIRKGMIVIDVGANIGYYTRLFSNLVGPTGQVYAFEPDAENWKYLVHNVRNIENIKIFNMAVTDKVGTVDFYHVIGATGIHTILQVPDSEKRIVPSVSLDYFISNNEIAQVAVVKIDVEGAEPLVFQGMKNLLKGNNKSPMVVFEYTPDVTKGFLEELQKTHKLYAINLKGSLESIQKLIFKKGKRLFANVVLFDN